MNCKLSFGALKGGHKYNSLFLFLEYFLVSHTNTIINMHANRFPQKYLVMLIELTVGE